MERQLNEKEFKTLQLVNTIDIDLVPVDELRKRYAMMATKLQAELQKNKEFGEQLQEAHGVRIQVRNL